jgi:hypothetical protein
MFVNNSSFNGTGGNYRNIQTVHSTDVLNYYYKKWLFNIKIYVHLTLMLYIFVYKYLRFLFNYDL